MKRYKKKIRENTPVKRRSPVQIVSPDNPLQKSHSEKTEKYYHTGVLLFTGSFSDKVAYKMI